MAISNTISGEELKGGRSITFQSEEISVCCTPLFVLLATHLVVSSRTRHFEITQRVHETKEVLEVLQERKLV